MVLSISGLGSQLALNLLDRTEDRQMELLRDDPRHKRAAEAFRERVGAITSPQEFVADFEVYSFVMRAYDLEDQIFGRGLIRKMLESDPSDSTALINRLTDSRFGELHGALRFTTADGPQQPDFNNPFWQQAIVDRYFERTYINETAEQNSTVGTVLEFREKVGEIDNWFDVLKDGEMTEFFQVALSLPSEMSGLDVDKQRDILEKKYALEKLADPEERDRLISRYVAISDALNPQTPTATSTGLQVLQSAVAGFNSWQFIDITLSIEPITVSRASLYN